MTRSSSQISRVAIVIALAFASLTLAVFAMRTQGADVTTVTLPNGGVQPQVAIDASGTIHVLYFQGDAANGNLFYTRLNPASLQFSPG